ncbi:MAG: beta-lactamase family protein, partial [Longimicrobiales bacterium]|nr:beta-lactamase family protein [Longimicrobiales bacterium]
MIRRCCSLGVLFTSVLAAVSPSASEGQVSSPASKEIEEWVAQLVGDSEIPGLAVGIVVSDSVLLLRGFGVREIGNPLAVDEHTAFQVASLTKSMTATIMAMLVDDGLVGWDDPVRRHLPEWGLADPWVSDHFTIRDALTMRSGIQGGDSIALYTDRSPAEILSRMHGLDAPRFRGTYADAPNLMYFLAGEVIRGVTGRSYEGVLRERILLPLGMQESTTRSAEFTEWRNVAIGHARGAGGVQPTVLRNVENVMSAAGLMTTSSDLVRWVRLNLGIGVFEGRRLVSEETLREAWRPQNILTPAYQALFNPNGLLNAYGFGWVVSE